MHSDGESVVGHKEQMLDPKRQLEMFERCLNGEKIYSNIEIARKAVKKALENAKNIVYTSGHEKGQRKYSDSEIAEMKDKFVRMTDKDVKNPSEAPEILQIKALISESTSCYSGRDTDGAKKKFEKAIEILEKAKSEGLDIKDLESTIKSLSGFFK